MRAAVAVCVAASLSLAACGGGPAAAVSAADGAPMPEEPLVIEGAAGAHRGGRFSIVTSTAPQTFNPVTATTIYSIDITSRMFVRLARFNPVTQEDEPSLASSWECPPDGLSCTFHLRHGARFSDGHPITADDVLFTAETILDKRNAARPRESLMVGETPLAFSAPDAQTVVVRSPEPNGSLLALVATAITVLPRHVLEQAQKDGTLPSAYGIATPPEKLVTSGPWMLKAHLPNERVVLTRNPYWFGVDTRGQRLPYLDELVVAVAPDQDAADLKFRAGEVDAVSQPKPENFAWYEANQRDGRFTLYDLGPESGPMYLVFNLNTGGPGRTPPTYSSDVAGKWLRNAAFRRAVSLAIDRDAIIAAVLEGHGAKYWSYSTPSDKKWSLPDVLHYDHDPDAARRLLASLGLRDTDADGFVDDGGRAVGFVLRTASSNLVRVRQANFVRDDLAKVGIKVILQPVEFNTLSAGVTSDFRYDVAFMGVVPPRPDPLFGLGFWRSSGNHPWNPRLPAPDSPEQAQVDQLADAIKRSTDYEVRKRMWRDLHAIANEQAWVVWMPVATSRVPVRDRFANLKPAPGGVAAGAIIWNAEEFFVKGS